MEFQAINIGLHPNDGTGDCLRLGGQKINENFAAITDEVGGLSFRFNQLVEVCEKTAEDPGTRGDWALGDDYLYLCTQTGEAGFAIWKRIPLHILT